MSTTSEFLTVEELATLLKLPVSTVRRWRRYGQGPAAHRVGKYLRFRRCDVDAWLAAQREQPRAS